MRKTRIHRPLHTLPRHVHALFGALVLLIVVSSGFAFLRGAHGQSLDPSSQALIVSTQNLQASVNELRGTLETLAGQLQRSGPVQFALQPGVSDCLDSCQSQLKTCFETLPKNGAKFEALQAYFLPKTPAMNPQLDSCRSKANTCMNACRPRDPSTLSCEDRCAVVLGGCVLASATSTEGLADCVKQNRSCLIAACRPSVQDASAPNRVPSNICPDQCSRAVAICTSAAKFDTARQAVCATIMSACETVACTAQPAKLEFVPPVVETLPSDVYQLSPTIP